MDNNSILIYAEGDAMRHRFCPEAEARKYLEKVAAEGGSASMMSVNVGGVDLVYRVSPDLRGKVEEAKTRLKGQVRFKKALDRNGVPMDRQLRAAILQSFDDLASGAV